MKSCAKAIAQLLGVLILIGIGIGVGVTLTAEPDASEPTATAEPFPTPTAAPVAPSPVAAAASPITTAAPVTPSPTLTPTRTPAPTRTPTPDPEPQEHVVQPGDTLRSIAEQFDTTIEVLVEANDIEDPDVIRTGSTILIPPSATTSPAPKATPTRTPRPRPTPTRAPASCPTTAEARYMRALAEELDAHTDGTSALNNLLALLAVNPALGFTEDFKVTFALSAAVIMVAAESILDLDPPSARARSLHNSAASMARKTIEGTFDIAEGIEEFDGDKIVEGGDRFGEAQGDMQRLVRSLERFCE